MIELRYSDACTDADVRMHAHAPAHACRSCGSGACPTMSNCSHVSTNAEERRVLTRDLILMRI